MLDIKQKKARVASCRTILKDYSVNWNEFIDNLLTVDETWVYYQSKETLRTAGRWQKPGERQPEVGRIGQTSKKVMATVFWNCRGIVHVDYLATGKSINQHYYNDLLKTVYENLPKSRRRKVIFLQDNAPPHKAKKNIELIASFGWTLLDHPAYSPDLSPSDFYLFKLMKTELFGFTFRDASEAETEVTAYFESKSKKWFFDGISMIRKQFETCIQNKGEY